MISNRWPALSAAVILLMFTVGISALACSAARPQAPPTNPEDEDLTAPRPEPTVKPAPTSKPPKPAKTGAPGSKGAAGQGPGDAPDADAPGTMLIGVASWDVAMVQEYFKKEHVDIAAQPAAFLHQSVLDTLNPEFALRARALMSYYQALGANDLGIIVADGGLRNGATQIELFKKGRRIRLDNPATPVDESKRDGKKRDGSVQEDWEPIPGFAGGTVTDAWGPKTWHAYGMAVDFNWFPNGVYNTSMMPHPHENLPNPASPLWGANWQRTSEAAMALGLCPGKWWSTNPDQPHIEWHPRMNHNPNPAASARPPGLPPGAPSAGTAIGAGQVDYGYKWKLPSKIYSWHKPKAGGNTLDVYELTQIGNWICVRSHREVHGEKNKDWGATWTTFDPPVRLFPTWIPTIELMRNEDSYPQDAQWRGKTTVTVRGFSQALHPDGTISQKTYTKVKGIMHYYPRLTVRDWQKEVDKRDHHHMPNDALYDPVRDKSIYDVNVDLKTLMAGAGSMERVLSKQRMLDEKGRTTDVYSSKDDYVYQATSLAMGWNRDTGEVGAMIGWSQAAFDPSVRGAAFELKPSGLQNEITVMDHLPAGAWDKPVPPKWPPPNPLAGTLPPLPDDPNDPDEVP